MWQSRVEYAATILDLGLPILETEPQEVITVGGASEINGVSEAFEHYTVNTITITVQCYESEHAAVEAWLMACRRNPGTPFVFQFNKTDATTRYSVYLRAPAFPNPLRFKRGKPYGILTVEITLQTVNPAVRFNVNFSGI